MRTMTITSSTRNAHSVRTPKRHAKRVVLAGRFAQAAKLTEQLGTLGWEVHTLPVGYDIHEATAATAPHAVLVPEVTGDESGYLACAKLRHTLPNLKVVVVGSVRTPTREALALFVGAGFVAETDGVNGLVAAMS